MSTDEKIDYIYHYIKRQEQSARIKKYIKIIFYLAIFIYFYVAIFVMLPKMLRDIIP